MVKIGNIELPEFPLLLAPMEDVSDPPFRKLCKMHGADLMYSEFISSEGLIRDAIKSRKKLDINFGCPVKKVVCKGAGAGVLKDIDLMVRLTKAVVSSTHLPVTVKTRLGWDNDSINIDEVAERLQDVGIKALTIHARTRAQMYKGEADWENISRIKNNPNIEIPIFGNGDVDSPEKALEYKNKYNCDGIMIGRGAIGYPWIFNEIKHFFQTGEILPEPTIAERLEAVKNHALWSVEWKGERSGIVEMRQHYSNYFRGIPHFKEFKTKFLQALTLSEIDDIIEETKHFYQENLI